MSAASTTHLIYDDTDPTGTSYSSRFSMRRGSMFSLHIINGGLTGTLTLWATNLPSPDLTDDTDWVQTSDVTFTALAGASKELVGSTDPATARWYRVKYVHSSGTGDLDIWSHFGPA